MKKIIKKIPFILFSIILMIVAFPYFFFKWVIKKHVEHIKLKKKIKEQDKEKKEVLDGNKKANDIIDSLYAEHDESAKDFLGKLKLRRARKTN